MAEYDTGRHKRRRTIEENIRSMADYVSDAVSSSSSDTSTTTMSQISQHVHDPMPSTSAPPLFDSAESWDTFDNDFDDSLGGEPLETLSGASSYSDTGSDLSEDNNLAHMDTDTGEELGLQEMLQAWAVNKGITHSAIRGLLQILHPFHQELPLDPRTLLCTSAVKGVIPMDGGGFYYHFGISNGIQRYISEINYTGNDIKLQFNIDGLPIHKSSKTQLWPILAMIKNLDVNSTPFMCALFMAKQKPRVNFLDYFVQEMKVLLNDGLEYNGNHYAIQIDCFVCDTPARCLVKQTKLYSGYHGCDHCSQYGLYNGRMTFPEIGHAPRTDMTFQRRDHEQHHIGDSPLEELGIGMCSKFPLDYMHCCLLGCMKKILGIWMKGPLKSRFSAAQKQMVSEFLVSLKKCISSDFARRPRSLEELEFWKATEFRSFLLYTGCVALKGVLKTAHYNNFLTLCIAIRLLLVPTDQNISNAEQLLEKFVEEFGKLYGAHTLVYNIHCLTHLASNVREHGSLENFSAFPFENYLYSLKKLIRGSRHVMQQAIRRISEQEAVTSNVEQHRAEYPQLGGMHTDGPIPAGFTIHAQYRVAKLEAFTINVTRDNCVQIGTKIVMIKNILSSHDNVLVAYQVFSKVGNLFSQPTKSSKVGIYKVSGLSDRLRVAPINLITKKCTLLNYKKNARKYVAVTILHSV